MLGALLGQVLRESGGDVLFDDVERLRQATIEAYADESAEAFERATRIVEEFTVQRADEVARAFTAYFHLVNLAEEHQRVRVLRERPDPSTGSGTDPKTDTVAGAFAQLTAEVGADEARRRLGALRFHPVFTAHPTEARRRAVSSSIRRLADLLSEHDAATPGGAEAHRARRRMLEEVDTLWRTAPLRAQKPAPTDEVRTVMSVFDETLFTTVPHVYRRIDDALRGEESGSSAPIVPAFVRIGSWVGGDRDGNPFVTAAVTREAAGIAAEHVLRGLERALERIGRTLTLDAESTPPSPALLALWETLSARPPGRRGRRRDPFPVRAAPPRGAAARAPGRRDPHAATGRLHGSGAAARGPAHRTGLARGGRRPPPRVRRRAAPHLAGRDIRLPPRRTGGAPALRRARQGPGRTRGRRRRQRARPRRCSPSSAPSREIQRAYGPRAAGRYVVSFTQSAQDLANVHRLAQLAVRRRRCRCSTWCRCSRRSPTCRRRRGSSPRSSSTPRSPSAWPRRAGAWRSCSATPTRRRTSVRSPRTSRCTRRRPRSRAGRSGRASS